MKFINIIASLACGANALVSNASYFYRYSDAPLIIGHRGNWGNFPEHTYGSYSAAIEDGVDYLELDTQVTKDGQLIMSHDPTLNINSNINDHPEFADRMMNISFQCDDDYFDFDNDWLIHDFTLAEIKTLRRS